jgi:hypothetical protein
MQEVLRTKTRLNFLCLFPVVSQPFLIGRGGWGWGRGRERESERDLRRRRWVEKYIERRALLDFGSCINFMYAALIYFQAFW